MKSKRLLGTIAAIGLVLAACGDDDSEGAADQTTAPADDAAPVDDTSGGDTDEESSDGGAPEGTATVDGTEYTIVATLQCLVALDEANQISLSGTVPENDGDELVEWAYDWDSDDGANEFRISVSEEAEFRTFDGFADFGDPEVNGQSVSASGMLVPDQGDPVEASFEIDCSK